MRYTDIDTVVNYHQEPLFNEALNLMAAIRSGIPSSNLRVVWHLDSVGLPSARERSWRSLPLLNRFLGQIWISSVPIKSAAEDRRWPTALEWLYDGRSKAIVFGEAGGNHTPILSNLSFSPPYWFKSKELGNLVKRQWQDYGKWVIKQVSSDAQRLTVEARVRSFLAQVDEIVANGGTLAEYYRQLLDFVLMPNPVQFATMLDWIREKSWGENSQEMLRVLSTPLGRKTYNEVVIQAGMRPLGSREVAAWVIYRDPGYGLWRRRYASVRDLRDGLTNGEYWLLKGVPLQMFWRWKKLRMTVLCGNSPYAGAVNELARRLEIPINPLLSIQCEGKTTLTQWFLGETEKLLATAQIREIS